MFEVENLPASFVTPFVLGDAAIVFPDLNDLGQKSHA
jgi:hypothetical protein